MSYRYYFFLFIMWVIAFPLNAQKLELLNDNGKASLRGLAFYENTVWVSGSLGTVGRSGDGGKTWNWMQVKGFEKKEFRDIEVRNEQTAYIMSVGSPANILKTVDGGKNWNVVYENKHPSMFLDAMSFNSKGEGIVVGDPINSRIFIAKTKGGDFWQETNELNLPKAINGEAFFAASGSNIVLDKKRFYIVSGGMASRFFTDAKSMVLPLMQGKETTGANSVAVNNKLVVVAGGDFNAPERTDSILAVSKNRGRNWQMAQTPPSGYRSSVCFVTKNVLVTCGINGIDISYDGGLNWKNISREGFNTCIYNKTNRTVYFAGNKNRVGKISF